MEFVKISHFVDLESTNKEKEALIRQVEEIISKIKAVGDLELKLSGAQGAKETLKAMQDLNVAQAALIKNTKAYEKAVLDKAKADKLSAQAAEINSKATLNAARAQTENAKAAALTQKYTAQLNKEREKVTKLSEAEQKKTEKLGNAYEQLKAKYQIAANTAKRLAAEELQVAAAHGLQSNELKEATANTAAAQAAAQKYYLELVKIEDAVGQSQRKVGQYTNATFALTQVLREAPAFAFSFQTGIAALGNNLPILFDQFKQLSTQLGSNTKAFGILARSIFSFTGLLPIGLLVVQLFSKQIGEFFSSLGSGSRTIDKMRESQKLLNKAFEDGGYKDAVKNVNELRINIDLARKGFLDKKAVLNQYNETLGDTIGKAGDLDEAEALLVKNGPAYIKTTLLKAAANLALEEAAQKALEIEKKRSTRTGLENVDLRRSAFEGATKEEIQAYNKLNQEATNAFLAGDKKLFDALSRQADSIFAARTEKGFAARLKKERDDLLDIAKSFQTQAAQLATDFNIDLFGGKFDDKDKKAKDLEDFKSDLEKEAAERLKISNEITRTRLEGEAAALQFAASRERQLTQERGESIEAFTARQAASLQDQYDGYQKYYNKVLELTQFNTRAELAELALKTKEEKRQVEDKLKDKDLTVKQREDLQATLLAIDARAAEEKALIELKGNESILSFDREFETILTELMKKGLYERIKNRLEYFQKVRDLLQKEYQFQADSLEILRTGDFQALNKQLRNQEISLEEFNKRKLALAKRYAIEELDNQIFYFEELLKKTADNEEERRSIEAKIADLRLKKDNEITQQKIDNLQKLADAQKRLGEEAFNTFTAIVAGRYDAEKNAVQDLIDQLEEKKKKDIETAQATAANAQEAADKVALINAKAAAEREALERRQRQIDQEKARFEKVANIAKIIADTASAVVEALPNVPLAITVGAIGALQLARVLATPVPRYAEGLDEARSDHFAVVGDGGRRELVRYPDGSSWVTPDRATLTFLPKGSAVEKDAQAALVYDQLAPGFTSSYSDNALAQMAGVFKSESKKTREAIKNKRENYWSIKNGEVFLRTREGYNETDYLNRNLNF